MIQNGTVACVGTYTCYSTVQNSTASRASNQRYNISVQVNIFPRSSDMTEDAGRHGDPSTFSRSLMVSIPQSTASLIAVPVMLTYSRRPEP